SHHHNVRIESPDNTTRVVTLADGTVPADRDFELTWKPAAEKAPSVGLFREHVGDADYLLAFVTPPAAEQTTQKPLPRQIVFLTDGEIGNEQQLFETITAMRGRSRIFMVGIGSAPNAYLMTRASELGRGAFTHIGSVEQVEERMRGLFAKLENPAVTGLTVKFSDASADVTPAVIPDVYRDEPLVLAARLDKLAGSMEIKGRIGDRPWVVTLPLANAAEGKGLSKLWARRKISDAEVARTTRQVGPEDA